jgi:hypothetical protein
MLTKTHSKNVENVDLSFLKDLIFCENVEMLVQHFSKNVEKMLVHLKDSFFENVEILV